MNNVGGNENLKDPLCNTDDWQKILNLNLLNTIEINNFFIPYMRKKWEESVIFHLYLP